MGLFLPPFLISQYCFTIYFINYINVYYEIFLPNFTNFGGLYDLFTAMHMFLN